MSSGAGDRVLTVTPLLRALVGVWAQLLLARAQRRIFAFSAANSSSVNVPSACS